MTLYSVRSEDDENAGRKRDHLTVWSGPFASNYEASGVSLPKGDGYMLTLTYGGKVRVTCPTPRTDDNYAEIDAAINAALRTHYREQVPGDQCARTGCGLMIERDDDLPYCSTECSIGDERDRRREAVALHLPTD